MKKVFISGVFDILHPGHIRFIKFSGSMGDFLTVGIIADQDIKGQTLINEVTRSEGMKSINYVDEVIILKETPESYIKRMKPEIVVKGDEHKNRFNPEELELIKYGGKLIFSSGKFNFSSNDFINSSLTNIEKSNILIPEDFNKRHNIKVDKITQILKDCFSMRVCVIGDLILDEYNACETLGLSQEDSTVVYNPVKKDRYIGGAGIVAAHAAALSNNVRFLTFTGDDESSNYCFKKLKEYGVKPTFIKDDSLETIVKVRYNAQSKTIFRLTHLKQNFTTIELRKKFIKKIKSILNDIDIIILSDFNYGVLSKEVVDEITYIAREKKIFIAADSQISSQFGNINKFKNVDLIMPTEYEIRRSLNNSDDGLVVLADRLRKEIDIKQLIITLGANGSFLNLKHNSKIINDYLPALNTNPKHVSGAGDAMLVYTAIPLAFGASPWEAGLLGSLAAATQVGRIGNLPVSIDDIKKVLE